MGELSRFRSEDCVDAVEVDGLLCGTLLLVPGRTEPAGVRVAEDGVRAVCWSRSRTLSAIVWFAVIRSCRLPRWTSAPRADESFLSRIADNDERWLGSFVDRVRLAFDVDAGGERCPRSLLPDRWLGVTLRGVALRWVRWGTLSACRMDATFPPSRSASRVRSSAELAEDRRVVAGVCLLVALLPPRRFICSSDRCSVAAGRTVGVAARRWLPVRSGAVECPIAC